MKIELLKASRRVWQEMDYIPRELARKNQLKWVHAIRMLGDKWVLMQPLQRKEE
jgi:hypothetical protein